MMRTQFICLFLLAATSCATHSNSRSPSQSLDSAEVDGCDPPAVTNVEAKRELMKETRLVYVRPTSPDVPDTDPHTVQFMVMHPADSRASHTSADGQVLYLRAETNDEPCSETFTRLLDESYDRRLQRIGSGDGA
jgi:hypothetical protein